MCGCGLRVGLRAWTQLLVVMNIHIFLFFSIFLFFPFSILSFFHFSFSSKFISCPFFAFPFFFCSCFHVLNVFFFSDGQKRKNSQKVPVVNMTTFLYENPIWESSVDRRLGSDPFGGDLPLSFVMFFSIGSFLSSFLCFYFSFTFISLLAYVSVFGCRCFLCSRCSMEMWCPYDTGRESWARLTLKRA